MWHPPSTPPPTPIFLPLVGGEEGKKKHPESAMLGSVGPTSHCHQERGSSCYLVESESHFPPPIFTCHLPSFEGSDPSHRRQFHPSLRGSIQYCIRAANRFPCDIALRTGYREHVFESWEWHPDLARGGPRTTLANPSALSGSVFATFLSTSVKQPAEGHGAEQGHSAAEASPKEMTAENI